MKSSISLIVLSLGLLAFDTNAANTNFNHKGVQKGSISESCYREPCGLGKVMSFEILKKTPQTTLVKLKLVGGTRPYNSKKITWNHNFHNVYVTCSIKNPTIQSDFDSQVTVPPINPEGSISGVLIPDTELYLHTCHNYKGAIEEAAKKYGYNVKEF
ncbi:hypothetical protein [Psychrobacter sp. NPDC078631]|uniref:hypothetical protein n=1 Tax=Psychrobacter sp. NPDC078631 TaxID=3390666 RepID=UPI003D04F21D